MAFEYPKCENKFFNGDNYVLLNEEMCLGLNVGYECMAWRYKAFSEFLFDHLIEFATQFTDLCKMNTLTSHKMLVHAAQMVYTTEKYGKRGEFGELILHAILREQFGTEPVISKLYFKSATNDTVKGFDAVHVLETENGNVELWLGEVKFYTDIKEAVSAVVGEIKAHLDQKKLKEEFICVGPHIGKGWKFESLVSKLMDPRTSLDDVFPVICIPVLLTYESEVVQSANKISDEFLENLKLELSGNRDLFFKKLGSLFVKVKLILLPLENKKRLANVLNEKLKGIQE